MKTKWIWINKQEKDQHAIFIFDMNKLLNRKYLIKISCDSIFAFYINNELAGFSQCSDFSYYKLYNEFDITNLLIEGNNKISIKVWYLGNNSSCYFESTPGLFFEVYEDDKLIKWSDENIQSTIDICYEQGLKKNITIQLGYSFALDLNKEPINFSNSVVVNKENPIKKPISNCVLGNLTNSHPITKKGNYQIYELDRETVGFIDFDIVSSKSQKIKVIFGEHLHGERVDEKIGGRLFSLEFTLKEGSNICLEPLRRIAAKYLEIQYEYPLDINHISIKDVSYPQKWNRYVFENDLDNKIFEACLNTLNLCMHDHYEDCPWREQSLYALDSRNQMLCGYYAYDDTSFQRHNLVLLSKSLNKEFGLLRITAPNAADYFIPSFSLFFIQGVYEYIKYTKDESILDEVGDVLDTIMETFSSRIDNTNLVPSFIQKECWNFYEWVDDSAGQNNSTGKYDALLSMIYVYEANFYNQLGRKYYDTSFVSKAIQYEFYDEVKNVYRLNERKDSRTSQLVNSFAVLIGIGNNSLENKLLNDKDMIKCSLSMKCFLYDALLTNESYKDKIIEDIRNTYKPMLISDFNTVWETELGWIDFKDAGSMCHGWSSIPMYYLINLLKCKRG